MADKRLLNAAAVDSVALYPESQRTNDSADSTTTNFDINFCGFLKIHSYSLTAVIALFHVLVIGAFAMDLYNYMFCIYTFLPFAIHCTIIIFLIVALVLKKSLFLLPFLAHQWIIFFFSMAIAIRFGLSVAFPDQFALYPKRKSVSTIGNMVVEDFWIEVMVILITVIFAFVSSLSIYVAHKCRCYLKMEEENQYDVLSVDESQQSTSTMSLSDSRV